jgi:cytochrome b561
MQWKNSQARYGAVPQAVHWLTFLCVTAAWLIGTFLDDFPKGAPRSFGLLTHMTLGQCVFVLVLVRLVWRFVNPPPATEQTPFGPLLELAARLSHYVLYALLLAIPFLGMVVDLKRGDALPIFGVFEFNSPWPADKAVAKTVLQVHGLLANALMILAGIHAVAALTHHYVFRDRTLVRMLPGAG